MSKDSFNLAGVPHYASPDTKPLRPRAPNELPDWLVDKRIGRMRTCQAIFKWIRANWKEGDRFFIGEGAPAQPTYNLLNRYGCFIGLKAQGGGQTRVVVNWLDEGHRIHPGATTFYKYARKINSNGEEIEIPRIDWSSIHSNTTPTKES